MGYDVATGGQLLSRLRAHPGRDGQHASGGPETDPAGALRDGLRWRLTEDGRHVALRATDTAGEDVSVLLTLGDVWAFFLSFFASTAAALEQSGLEPARAGAVAAEGVKVSASRDGAGLTVGFLGETGAPVAVGLDRTLATELYHALAAGLETSEAEHQF